MPTERKRRRSGTPAKASSHLARRLTAKLEEAPDVLVAYLFGSRARGGSRSTSDVDVAVLLRADGDVGARQLELAALLQDACPDRLDLVILNEAPVALAFRVLRDGQLLLSRDDRARIEHWVHTVDRYIDMEPARRTLEEGQRHRLEEGRFGRP